MWFDLLCYASSMPEIKRQHNVQNITHQSTKFSFLTFFTVHWIISITENIRYKLHTQPSLYECLCLCLIFTLFFTSLTPYLFQFLVFWFYFLFHFLMLTHTHILFNNLFSFNLYSIDFSKIKHMFIILLLFALCYVLCYIVTADLLFIFLLLLLLFTIFFAFNANWFQIQINSMLYSSILIKWITSVDLSMNATWNVCTVQLYAYTKPQPNHNTI